ncbi:hypothetical protein VAPA_2c00910 [Variovorax paradoxus B4]|uniref:Uncharacterized protein n=1 Tax=Variovorax paradoxus B4 TaxID=1246301 RepID=T1XK41_VARPD|nr:hypothetical protein VAPA_2c00910 [Variovorax paradoxus B4]
MRLGRSLAAASRQLNERPRKTLDFRKPGDMRTFLEDGDAVILRGYCELEGFRRIGFWRVPRHRRASARVAVSSLRKGEESTTPTRANTYDAFTPHTCHCTSGVEGQQRALCVGGPSGYSRPGAEVRPGPPVFVRKRADGPLSVDTFTQTRKAAGARLFR